MRGPAPGLSPHAKDTPYAYVVPPTSTEVPTRISTGKLPEASRVAELVHQSHRKFAGVTDGNVASYIPALADADEGHFGLVVTRAGRGLLEVGDTRQSFTVQSVSKMFVYAAVVEALGHGVVRDRVGVNNTGLPFDSVMAVELNDGHPMNPMVNAGAIATSALLPGADVEERWHRVCQAMSAFAGRDLVLDERVYASESETNDRNKALGQLLASYGYLDGDPLAAVDLYTRQCSLTVTAYDLAVMGATLASGGINPLTQQRVVSADVCRDTLAVVAANGLYERSGEWLFEIGLPAKSGVSGGILAVAPGKGAVASFSPPLDRAGNSVRGQLAIGFLSRALGLNLFASGEPESATA